MAIALVQSTSGGVKFVSGTTTSLAVDFGSNIGAGNFAAVLASFWDGSDTPENELACSITGESTPTKISTADNPGGGSPASAYIFWLKNTTGGNKGITLTSSGSAGNTFITAIALEFSGINTVSPADGNHANNNHTSGVTTITTTALTPTASGDLFLAMLEETNGATLTNTSSGWTVAFNGAGGGQQGMGLYKISSGSSAETATATFTTDGDDWWAAPIAAFKAAGGGATAKVPAYLLHESGRYNMRHRQPQGREWARRDRIFIPRHLAEGEVLVKAA